MKSINGVLLKSLIGVIVIVAVLTLSHIIFDNTNWWYQSKVHAIKIALFNSKYFGYESDSLYVVLTKSNRTDSNLVVAYKNAYYGTVSFMRGMFTSMYLENDVLKGISYDIISDTICFVITENFISCNAVYHSYVTKNRLVKITRVSPCENDTIDIRVDIREGNYDRFRYK